MGLQADSSHDDRGLAHSGASPALAVEGAESERVGPYRPRCRRFETSSGRSTGRPLGVRATIDSMYKTSVEAEIRYGLTGHTEMLGVDALLRTRGTLATMRLSPDSVQHDNWNQEGPNQRESTPISGRKIVAAGTPCSAAHRLVGFVTGLYDPRTAGTARDNGGGLVNSARSTSSATNVGS